MFAESITVLAVHPVKTTEYAADNPFLGFVFR